MLLYYIRHGDPIYSPDSLTPLGERQAQALAKRLALYGVDKVYSSTSNRAILTANPTCELLKIQLELLDFANESHAARDFYFQNADGGERSWVFLHPQAVNLFNSKEIRDLGDRWYDHPAFKDFLYEKGVNRIYTEMDALLGDLGYEHLRYTGKYKVTKANDQRVALFAHQGFGLAFLSCLLDIPYPMICTHFDMGHTGMTVIDFSEQDGYCVPKVFAWSLDSHLYREGLPTKYNNFVYF